MNLKFLLLGLFFAGCSHGTVNLEKLYGQKIGSDLYLVCGEAECMYCRSSKRPDAALWECKESFYGVTGSR